MPENYLLLVGILMLTRAADLLSTYHVTPKLFLESNQWMRRLGWRRTILVNALVVVVFPLLAGRHGTIIFGTFSLLLAYRNYVLVPSCRGVGEGQYQEVLRRYFTQVSLSRFLAAVLVKLAVFMSLGLAVMGIVVVDQDRRMWFIADIGRAFIFFGLFVAMLEVLTRTRYRGVQRLVSEG